MTLISATTVAIAAPSCDREGINNKLQTVPTDAEQKLRKTLGRIVNEGKGGVICILL